MHQSSRCVYKWSRYEYNNYINYRNLADDLNWPIRGDQYLSVSITPISASSRLKKSVAYSSITVEEII
jgi:hypothetical protein